MSIGETFRLWRSSSVTKHFVTDEDLLCPSSTGVQPHCEPPASCLLSVGTDTPELEGNESDCLGPLQPQPHASTSPHSLQNQHLGVRGGEGEGCEDEKSMLRVRVRDGDKG